MTEKEKLAKLGLLDSSGVEELSKLEQPYLIQDFLLNPSVNILCGHSGLGKSALCAQIGICVASGRDFLKFKVEDPGVVMYCDAESTPGMMLPMEKALAEYLGLDGVPKNFLIWNPGWTRPQNGGPPLSNAQHMIKMVKEVKPKLVVIDSLRNFYRRAAETNDEAARIIESFRKLSAVTGTSFLMVHHLRKTDKEEKHKGLRPTVRSDINAWLEESAGSFALINNTDTRLGWEQLGREKALWLGGFTRVHGEVGPFRLMRELDSDTGDPKGYRLASPKEQLTGDMQVRFEQLVDQDSEFSYKTLRQMGMSTASASRFLRKMLELGLAQKIRDEVPDEGGHLRKFYQVQRDQLENGEDVVG